MCIEFAIGPRLALARVFLQVLWFSSIHKINNKTSKFQFDLIYRTRLVAIPAGGVALLSNFQEFNGVMSPIFGITLYFYLRSQKV